MPDAPIRTVLFDLDGTLIDHFGTIYRCYRHALEELGLEPRSYEHVKATVGGGIQVTFSRLVPADYVQRGVELWTECFNTIWHEGIEVLPGAEALLRDLPSRGIQCAIYTNKEGPFARRIAARLGWEERLAGAFGRLDTPWAKPHRSFTLHVLYAIGADATSSIMIGDSPFDIDTAANAGLRGFAVATGSHTLEQLRQTPAEGVFPDLPTLARALWN